MKKIILALALSTALIAPTAARADDVGAVIGGLSGLVIAGPPGAIAGVIIGAIFGKPWWGVPQPETKCWIDSNFSRHCPQFPVN